MKGGNDREGEGLKGGNERERDLKRSDREGKEFGQRE